jgi:hypothetical protein
MFCLHDRSMEGQLDQLQSVLAGADNHTRSFLASALQAASTADVGQEQQEDTDELTPQEAAKKDEGETAECSQATNSAVAGKQEVDKGPVDRR